jgi:hypothetical protein
VSVALAWGFGVWLGFCVGGAVMVNVLLWWGVSR